VLETAQRQLGRLYAAADDGAAFDHQAAVSGFREISGGQQTVVSGACNHDVE
jgi:hypothetical protein